MRSCCHLILYLLAGTAAAPLMAQSISFEGIVDSTVVTNQFTAAAFTNAIVLSAGITLNEFEFPPYQGSNVASDNGGPMTISFASPVRGFRGFFTYSVPLTIQALGASNNVLATATSAYSSNEALSGASGSHANELLSVSSPGDIYKVVITGGSQGTSFVVDDVTVFGKCDLNRDGATNALDVQAIIGEALGASNPLDDLNLDGAVNVVDIQIVIDATLNLGCSAR